MGRYFLKMKKNNIKDCYNDLVRTVKERGPLECSWPCKYRVGTSKVPLRVLLVQPCGTEYLQTLSRGYTPLSHSPYQVPEHNFTSFKEAFLSTSRINTFHIDIEKRAAILARGPTRSDACGVEAWIPIYCLKFGSFQRRSARRVVPSHTVPHGGSSAAAFSSDIHKLGWTIAYRIYDVDASSWHEIFSE